MSAQASVAITTLFSPFDDTQKAFLDFVSTAQKRLDIVIYGFHLPVLSDLLIAKHKAGVDVSLILDHSQAEGRAEKEEVQKLVDAGVPLIIGTSPVHHQILHSKFTVVDESKVEFGSWNYSLSASQQSNTVSLVENAEFAKEFLKHHDRLLAFVRFHDMAYQLPKEQIPDDALPESVAA